jgi:hypothetical protein
MTLKQNIKILSFSGILKHINSMIKQMPEISAKFAIQILQQIQNKISKQIIKEEEEEDKDKEIICVGDILFLKLMSNLYSVSDFEHIITTPSIFIINQFLFYSKLKTRRNILYNLFLSNLAFQVCTFFFFFLFF